MTSHKVKTPICEEPCEATVVVTHDHEYVFVKRSHMIKDVVD